MKPLSAVLLLSSVFAAGCIAKRSGGTAFREREWIRGVTTKRDVVEAWGNPDSIDGNTWTWRETRHIGGKIKLSYRAIGATVSRMNAAHYEYRLRFDDSGRLLSSESSALIPDGEKWSLNPW